MKVTDGVYLFPDCANVYALVRQDRACLVGFASGRALDHLGEIGVKHVDVVLITHHHRDGLQGIGRALQPALSIVIPEDEAAFIESAGQHWAAKRIYVNYESASRFNAVTFNVPVSRKVKHGDRIPWGRHEFRVLATPGHTRGSVSYLIDFGDKRLAFTGDFYTAPGKTLTFHDLHWEYVPEPFTEALVGAENLKSEGAIYVCPEHGRPFEEDGAGLSRFNQNLVRLESILAPNRKKPPSRKAGDAIGPHAVFVGEPVTYALLSDSKHAIIVDPGYLNEQDLVRFLRNYGVQSVDAITFTHYHEDHIARTWETVYSWLGPKKGPVRPEIWVFEAIADVLAHPDRYNIPCLFPMPIYPDRIIKEDEVIEWEDLDLKFKHCPGQTWYHTMILFEADGRKYAVVGDSVWRPADSAVPIKGGVIPRNRYFLDRGYEKVFQTLRDAQVDTILSGHYDPFGVTPTDLDRSIEWARSIKPAVAALVDQPHPGYGSDPLWAHFYPYRVTLEPPVVRHRKATVSLMIQNYFDRRVELEAGLVLPCGISSPVEKKKITLLPDRETAIEFEIAIEPQKGFQRRVVLADVRLDGRYLGQVAEMLVDDLPALPAGALK